MKYLTAAIFTVCFTLALPSGSNAIDIWHSNTVWAGQGMCAFSFTLDGQSVLYDDTSDGGLSDLTLVIILRDKNRAEIGTAQTVKLAQPFADSEATRYADFILEGDCEAESFGIRKATGVIGRKLRDLLETRQLAPAKFEPKEIVIPAKYGGK